MKRTLFILPILALITTTAALAKDDKLDAPPEGLTPTTATVSQILKRYDAAVGQLKAGVDDTHREVWHFSKSGLTGTETLTRQGFDFPLEDRGRTNRGRIRPISRPPLAQRSQRIRLAHGRLRSHQL